MKFREWQMLKEAENIPEQNGYKLWKECYFGGSFNPIHWDHVNNAIAAATQLGVKVNLVPAYNPTHKEGLAPFQDRVAMCKLVAQQYNFGVSTVEEMVSKLHPQGKTPTAMTIRQLFPNIEQTPIKVPFLVGSDSIESLHKWVEPEFLVNKIVWVVSQRDGGLIKNPNYPHMDVIQIKTQNQNISSTQIRDLVQKQQWEALMSLVPPKVVDYIRIHKLYQNNL